MAEILVPFFVPLPPSLGGDGVVVLDLPAVRARVVPQPVVHGPPQLHAVLMLAARLDLTGQNVPLTVPHHPLPLRPCPGADRVEGDVDVVVVRVAMDGDQAVICLRHQSRHGEADRREGSRAQAAVRP